MAASALFALLWVTASLAILGLLLLMRYRLRTAQALPKHRRANVIPLRPVVPLRPLKAELVIRVGD
jgi:hypothetical protein